jgi:hypothetical protein
MNGWIKEAKKEGKLRITDNMQCPYCNPTNRADVPTKLNACGEHLWVNMQWFTSRFGNKE